MSLSALRAALSCLAKRPCHFYAPTALAWSPDFDAFASKRPRPNVGLWMPDISPTGADQRSARYRFGVCLMQTPTLPPGGIHEPLRASRGPLMDKAYYILRIPANFNRVETYGEEKTGALLISGPVRPDRYTGRPRKLYTILKYGLLCIEFPLVWFVIFVTIYIKRSFQKFYIWI